MEKEENQKSTSADQNQDTVYETKKSISRPESSAKQINPVFFEKYLDLINEFSLNVFPLSTGLLRLNSDVE